MYVLLDDAANEDAGGAPPQDVALAVAQERIRSLEEQVAFLQAQLALEQQRSAELLGRVTDANCRLAPEEHERPWWQFW